MTPTLDRRSFLWCAAAVPAALAGIAQTLPPWLVLVLVPLWALALVLGWHRRTVSGLLRAVVTLGAAGLALGAYDFRFGRDTGAALLATMLVMKLLELRGIRDARSVLGFALFATTAGFLLDQGPMLLALSLLAVLVALSALAAVADLEAGLPAGAGVPSRLRAAGLLLVYSLPLATAGFFLFPRLASPLWGVPGRAEARTGLSEEMAPGDISALFLDDSPVLRVRYFGREPPKSAMYYRGPVLMAFDGRTWTRPRFIAEAMHPGATALSAPVEYEITQEPTDRRYVMALDVALEAPAGTGFDSGRTLIANQRIEQVRRFRLSSATAHRLSVDEPRTMRQWQTRIPGGFNPRTRELMDRWRAEGADDAAIIERALAWFNAEFTYTLDPVLLARHSVDDFLFETQQGYCEHFASTFTFMMRAAGIPARVVTGYQGGYFNPIGRHWVVRQSDAHAWSEVWFEGRGWVRVDPTAAVAPERIERGIEGLAGGDIAQWWIPLRNTTDWMLRQWNDLVLGFDLRQQRAMLRPFGLDAGDWRDLGLAFAAAAVLALTVTLWLVMRQRGPAPDPLVAAYRRFVLQLARAGVAKPPHEPPLRFAQRAAALLPEAADSLSSLSLRYVQWRYAGAALDPEHKTSLVRDLRRFRAPRRPLRRTAGSPS
ncbi:MAG TPA: DUF3488 and transglutaminase-like domain-containing protein [Xanthomonadaceae bacterium]|nr:DUF3488 and transglutaminase-like domain-containing protein [Xanthomonadaceae bacterium]